MFFQYETPRLLLKVLRADCAPQVLDFYNRDKELFEMNTIWLSNHSFSDFMFLRRKIHAGLSALCVYIISLRLSTEAVKLAINFPVSFTTWGMPLRQSASAPSLPLMSFACTR